MKQLRGHCRVLLDGEDVTAVAKDADEAHGIVIEYVPSTQSRYEFCAGKNRQHHARTRARRGIVQIEELAS